MADPHDATAQFTWTTTAEVSQRHRAGYLGGTPIAVLAGFTLTTAVTVVGQRPTEATALAALAPWSSLALVISSGCLFLALVWTGWATDVLVTPDEALSWFPEGRLDAERFEDARYLVRRGRVRSTALLRRALALWSTGVAVGGAGLSLALLSYGTNAGFVVASVGAALTGLVVALVAALGHPLGSDPPGRATMLSPEVYGLFSKQRPTIGPDLAAAATGSTGLFVRCRAMLEAACPAVVVEGASVHGLVDGPDGSQRPAVSLHPAASHAGRLLCRFDLDALAAWRGTDATLIAAVLGAPESVVPFGSYHVQLVDDALVQAALALPAH